MLILCFMVACTTTQTMDARILLSGNQNEVDRLTTNILNDETRVLASWIRDDRPLPPHILIRVQEPHRFTQLGVDTVSGYFLCLLQIKSGMTTKGILAELGRESALICLPQIECDICFSGTAPVSQEVRDLLAEYWLDRLSQTK